MSKIYGVYMAYSKYEVMPDEMCADNTVPIYPVEAGRAVLCETKLEQMELYANTPCPASQVFEADSLEDAEKKVDELKANFLNNAWLEENIYRYV